MTSNIIIAPARTNLRLIALSFNPENEEYKKETCLEQVQTVFKSSLSKHDCYSVDLPLEIIPDLTGLPGHRP